MKYIPIVSGFLYTLSVFGLSITLPLSVSSPVIAQEINIYTQAQQAFESKDYAQSQSLLLKALKKEKVPAGTYTLLVKTYLELDQKIRALNTIQQGLEAGLLADEKIELYTLKHSLSRYQTAEAKTMMELLLQQKDPVKHFLPLMETPNAEDYTSALFDVAKLQLSQALSNKNTLSQLQLLKTLDSLQPRLDSVSQRRYRFLLEDQWELHPEVQVLRNYVVADYLKARSYEFLLAFYRRELQIQAANWNAQEKSTAFQHIADLHFKLGYLEFAFKNYEISLEQNPSNLESLKRQGMIYLSQQRLSEARKTFKQIFARNPLDAENRYYLALTYYYKEQKADGDRLILGMVPQPHLQELVDLAQVNPEPPRDLWKLLTAAPNFLKSHTQ